jgi:hypothetical protein
MAAIAGGDRSDDESRVCFSFGPLGLGDDAPLAAPAVAGRPFEVLEAAGRLGGLSALLLRFGQFVGNRAGEAGVARQAEDVIDRIGFAPPHQGIAGKP